MDFLEKFLVKNLQGVQKKSLNKVLEKSQMKLLDKSLKKTLKKTMINLQEFNEFLKEFKLKKS